MSRAFSGDRGTVLEQDTTPLSGSATYTSDWYDVRIYPSVMMAVLADQDCTAIFDFSPDGSTVESSLSYNVFANLNEVHRLSVTRPYARLRVVNGSSAMSSFSSTFMAGAMPSLEAPRSLSVAQDADALIVRNLPAPLDIALGKYSGWDKVDKFGDYASVGTSLTDIWSTGGVLTYPTSAESLEILSSSANDTSAGSGARIVEVQGLDANWDLQTENVTMNGTSAVSLSNTFIRVFRIRVVSRGTYNAGNAGTITLRVSGGGATRGTIQFNATFGGLGTSQMSHYTVPNGKQALLTRLRATVEAAKPVNVYGLIRTNADDVSAPFLGNRFPPIILRSIQGNIIEEIDYPFLLPGKTDIKAQAFATSATTGFVSVSYQLLLIDDV
jgi:hypothetical protein